ncbi:DUF945 family protein [Marinobacter confluentis]|uniref:DUF945 family protein n=1 Tax=Marinobacter confluentis TaxID=1697557 RepID=UPI001CDA3B05|nr:DUF945 family protein [Marinobacter confluentis]
MKTQWIVIGVVVLGAAAAAPLGVGYYTEQQWQGVQSEFNSSQALLRLETREYDRGYMNSSVLGSVTFIGPDSAGEHTFDYQADVSHGITGSLMDFSTAEELSESAKKFFPDEQPRLTLETRVWGTATLEMIVPEVAVTDEESGETFAISRAEGRADIGSAGSELDVELSWPGMTLTGPDARISVSDFQMDQRMEFLTGDVWIGDANMTLASLQIDVPDQPAVRLDGLTMTSESDVTDDGKRMNGDSSIRLDMLEASGKAFGPHEIQVRFDGLDVASLDEISAAIGEMQQAAATSAGGADPQAAMQQQMESFQRISGAVMGLAAEGFSFGFPRIDLSTPQGPIQGELVISHPELSDDEKSQAMMVMQGLTGNFDLSMPVALVDQNPTLAMQVSPLIKQGMVVQDGDRLILSGVLEDMALDINGNVMPLPPLF